MHDCNEAKMTEFVNELLDVEQPDFVVFSGDNDQTFVAKFRLRAMQAVVEPVEARQIPYAMIFGNHDDENGFSRDALVEIAMSGPHSYTQRGPRDVAGVGNYEVEVFAPANSQWGAHEACVFRLYFLDSHAYPDNQAFPFISSVYDWIKPNQIEYYRRLSASHINANNSVPAIMFFHIPLVEYAANAESRTSGEKLEGVASSDVNTNLFSALVEVGDVKATFAGHDHVNEYCYLREGIQLCYGGGVGLGEAYGRRDFPRRARTIEWSMDANGQRTIISWKRHFGDLNSRHNVELLYEDA
ncbi:hypothetical protein P43SY_001599 [Pythium insidiosum]|uniref:Calcineurin-like phosphoesterase domain-containing protein n=1 Tax=Pythium insidiosum TaxID=114742 RepID=A0AAD5M639_PYTIN|nr:hypothetical protein P43SY_001599 [Pythium insidiosum]